MNTTMKTGVILMVLGPILVVFTLVAYGISSFVISNIVMSQYQDEPRSLESDSMTLEDADPFVVDMGHFIEDEKRSAGLGEPDLTSTIAQIIRVVLGFMGILGILLVPIGGTVLMIGIVNDKKEPSSGHKKKPNSERSQQKPE